MGNHDSKNSSRRRRARAPSRRGPLAAVAGAIALLAVVIATAVIARVPASDRTIETGALAGYRAAATYTAPVPPPSTVTMTAPPSTVTVTAPPAAAFTTPATPPGTQAPVTPAPAVQPSAAPQAVFAPQGSFLAKEEAVANTDCDLTVPADPLSARGLATPYQLSNGPDTTGCTMMNAANLGAFVQATILEPGGRLAVYNPLVITAGTQPAVKPVVPFIPFGSVITIASGFNGNILFPVGPGAGFFTAGTPGSPFGQEAWANAPAFYFFAEREARVPALGTSPVDHMTCPTVRDFSIVDQDPDDNDTAHYLLTAGGLTAQDNAANTANLAGAAVIQNGSDNNLIDTFVDPALGCTPFEAPDLSNPGAMTSSQQLDELLANRDQQAPVAEVEPGDPMTTIGSDDDIIAGDFPLAGNLNAFKTDLYRANVGQPFIPFGDSGMAGLVTVTQQWCQNLQTVGAARLALDAGFETGPSPTAGMTLAQFLAARFAASVSLVNCGLFNPGSTVVAVPGSAQAAAATPTPTPSVTTTSPSPTPSDTSTSPAPDVTTTSPAPDTTTTSPDDAATTPASTGP
jgi:hypothetical protein